MSEELQEVVITNPEWYRDLQYEDAKGFIQDNINNTCRSFVAIGYYLKYILDNDMYLQDGYQNIWDLAQAEFGISKSQASKFMSINDRFSKDGNSPVLLDTYKDFSSSKLSEMLYLTDEQLEQVKPVTTVAEIREIRKPEPEPEKVVSIPPKSKIEIDFTKSIDTLAAEFEASTAYACPPGQDDCRRNDWGPDGVYDRKKNGPSKACIGCWKDWLTAEKIKREVVSTSKQEIHDEAWFVKWYFENNPDDLAELMRICREHKAKGEAAKKFQEYRSKYGAYYKGCSEWSCSFHSFAGGIDFKVGLESIHLKYGRLVEEALKLYDPFDHKYDDVIPEPMNDDPETVDNEPEIESDVDEKDCRECSLNNNKDAGILECHPENGEHKCWIVDDSDQIETVEADIIQTESKKKIPLKQIPDKWYYLVPIGANDITGKAIREGDILEWTNLNGSTKQYQVYYEPRSFSFKACEIARIGTNTLISIPEHELRRSRIIRNIYDGEELISETVEEPVKPVQPELPILKNNDQRAAFIDNYETWPLWIDLKETGERYYRYDFDNGVSFVIRVSLRHKYIGWDKGGYSKTETEYGHEEYFILGTPGSKYEPKEKTFAESGTNKTSMIEYLKDYQKKGA